MTRNEMIFTAAYARVKSMAENAGGLICDLEPIETDVKRYGEEWRANNMKEIMTSLSQAGDLLDRIQILMEHMIDED